VSASDFGILDGVGSDAAAAAVGEDARAWADVGNEGGMGGDWGDWSAGEDEWRNASWRCADCLGW
jgi:hypothetical protein